MIPRTVFDAVLRLRKLDDRDVWVNNSLLVTLSGGHSVSAAQKAFADLRLVLRYLNDEPKRDNAA
jgi:hypothetical protein